MAQARKIKALTSLLFALLAPVAGSANAGCPPCGNVMTNLPCPSYDANSVQPYQNYVAACDGCVRGLWQGFYFDTGFGYGAVDYNLKIPGFTFDLDQHSTHYITEYIGLGYAFCANQFFLATELNFYLRSHTDPLFYEDTSSFVLTQNDAAGNPTIRLTAIPCSARVNIDNRSSVALDLLPGFSFGRCFNVFGRVGIEYDHYSWERELCFSTGRIEFLEVPLGVFVVNHDYSTQDTSNKLNYRLGVGASYSAGPHLSFTVNYIHIFGKEVTFTPDVTPIAANPPVVVNPITGTIIPSTVTTDLTSLAAPNTIDPTANEILFGIVVSF